jgi:hypothetical protein
MGFASAYPAVHWVSGQRYVAQGLITTTAGVTSGIAGALHVLGQLAGDDEAERIGKRINYPGWSLHGSTAIPVQELSLGDLPYGWNVAFPWFPPTWGIRLTDGADEIDVAAAFETYSGASGPPRRASDRDNRARFDVAGRQFHCGQNGESSARL